MSQTKEDHSSYGRFHIGEHLFAISADMLGEVVPVPHLVPFPNGSMSVLGAIQLRGTLVPLFDTLEIAGLGNTAHTPKAALVIRHNDQVFALGIDRVAGLTRVPSTEIQSTSGASDDFNVQRFFRDEGQFAVILDTEALFSRPDIPRAIKPRGRQKRSTSQRNSEPHLTFLCGGGRYAIAVNKLFNTVPLRNLEASDLSNDLFLGILEYLDRSIPVVNANIVLNLDSSSATEPQEVVIVHIGETQLLGFAVERILYIDYFLSEQIRPVPELLRKAAPLIKATLPADKTTDKLQREQTLIIDVDATATVSELKKLTNMSTKEDEKQRQEASNKGDIVRERERNLLFTASERFGTPISDIIRIIPPPTDVVPMQSNVSGMVGYFFFNDQMTPLIRLGDYLGFYNAAEIYEPQVIVCKASDFTCGFLVDHVLEVAVSNWRTDLSQPSTEKFDLINVPRRDADEMFWRIDIPKITGEISGLLR